MERFAAFEVEQGEGASATIALSGPWLVSTIGAVEEELEGWGGDAKRVDLTKITEIDHRRRLAHQPRCRAAWGQDHGRPIRAHNGCSMR